MKKKIIALCLIVALAATAVIGGTLAYFTDTDAATNTFTVGGVSIELIEQQTSKNGLVSFEQEKPLVPGTSSDGNAQSKIVTVKNNGENDAWVWVDMLIPSALLNPANPTNQSYNALHYNEYGAFSQDYWNTPNYGINASNSAVKDGVFTASGDGFVPTDPDMVGISAETVWTNWAKVGTETIDKIEYTILRTKMAGTLESGKITLPCLRQVYMDWRVTTTTKDGKTYFVAPDGTTTISADIPWEVIVRAYAIQANGIDSVDAAVTAYANNGKL